MNYAPSKFYQLHFQVRKNISTSKISKAFRFWVADPGRKGLGFSCWVGLGSEVARAQHPGSHSTTGSSEPLLCQPLLCTALLDQCLLPNSLFYSREPESLLFRLGLALCKFTSDTQVSPTSVTKQEQPFLWKSIGRGCWECPQDSPPSPPSLA